MMKIWSKAWLLALSLSLVGCQTLQSTQVIAKTFNLTTQMQQRLMDRGVPQDVLVKNNIAYHIAPNLHLDVYQAADVYTHAPRATIVWIHGGGGFRALNNMHAVILSV